MIDPVVRRRTDADVEQLRELERIARASLVETRGGARWLDTHAPGRWIDDGDVFVAVIDELVVGYLVVRLDGDVARVDEVFVLDEARELGFGDLLLATALRFARSQGARVLEGEALPGDRDTKNLYERAGITARLITVSTAL